MKQLRIHGPNDIRLDEVPDPEVGPRDVILRIAACGICGTDLSSIKSGGMDVANLLGRARRFSAEQPNESTGQRICAFVVVEPNPSDSTEMIEALSMRSPLR